MTRSPVQAGIASWESTSILCTPYHPFPTTDGPHPTPVEGPGLFSGFLQKCQVGIEWVLPPV
jgi:hypothetical protein